MVVIWVFLVFMEITIFLRNYITKNFIPNPITGATFYVDPTGEGMVPSW